MSEDPFAAAFGARRGLDAGQARERDHADELQGRRELVVSLCAWAAANADPAIDACGESNVITYVCGGHCPPVDDEPAGPDRAAVLAAWHDGL